MCPAPGLANAYALNLSPKFLSWAVRDGAGARRCRRPKAPTPSTDTLVHNATPPANTSPVIVVNSNRPVGSDKRIALVVGNSTYKNVPSLPNPARDAEMIAAQLGALGFETVTLETNVSREKLTNALKAFANIAEKAD